MRFGEHGKNCSRLNRKGQFRWALEDPLFRDLGDVNTTNDLRSALKEEWPKCLTLIRPPFVKGQDPTAESRGLRHGVE